MGVGVAKKIKEVSYLKSFIGGLDPSGVITLKAGIRNENAKSKHHLAHLGLAGVGGVLSGAAIIAPLVAAVTHMVGVKGGPKNRALAFLGGLKAPFSNIYKAMKVRKLIKGGAKNSEAISKIIHKSVFNRIKSLEVITGVPPEKGLNLSLKILLSSPATKKELYNETNKTLLKNLAGLSLAGGVSGASAIKQYRLGRRISRKEIK